jgi:hypothetical protein
VTLIITAMSPHRIVQVSDRRLTLPGGKLYDDEANKAITVNCDDAYFSVAYTGLARLRDRDSRTWVRTDKWAADTLQSIMLRPGWWGIRELYRAFAKEAERTFQFTPEPLTRKGATFVFAGFYLRDNAIGFVGIMSNMVQTPTGKIKVVREFDTQTVWSPAPWMTYNELELEVHGMVPALYSNDAIAKSINRRTKVIERRLERVQRGAGTRNDGAIVQELVKVVRMASRHPQYGRYIGRDCMGIQMRSDAPDMVTDTYKENNVEHNFPWMVSREMVATVSWSITPERSPDEDAGSG